MTAQVLPGTAPPSTRQYESSSRLRASERQYRPLTIEPSVSVEETFTDNVNLQPNSARRSDFVTELVPSIRVSGQSTRVRLDGTVAASAQLYARTGSNDRIVPLVNLNGTVEAVERFFFVDAAAQVSQDYVSPFGGRSPSLVNQPANQFTSQWYNVSPYVKGERGATLTYELRDNNIWTNLNNTAIPNGRSYTNEIIGNITRAATPLGWGLDYHRTDTQFAQQESQIMELARVRALWRPDPSLQLSASSGYEHNQFPLSDYRDVIYGVGLNWRPSERTVVDGTWEHRFFGSSYRVVWDHRTPLTAWSFAASRDVSSYPQLLAQFPSGGIVPLLLDTVFQTRIPDPIQRQQFVLAFMQDRGLPVVLTGPFNVYLQRFFLQENARASGAFIGARNTVLLNVYRTRTENISGTGQSNPLVDLLSNTTQVGTSLVWTHMLSGAARLVADVDYLRARANETLDGTSKQLTFRAVVITAASRNTNVHAGVRFQDFRSNITDGWREAAAFIGLSHTFR